MDRPESVSPEHWDNMSAKEREFVTLHEAMHEAAAKSFGVSRQVYEAIARQVVEGE